MLRIGHWNSHGIKGKCDNNTVLQWIYDHDVVFLSESKCNFQLSVPGFDTYNCDNVNTDTAHRGGVLLLIRKSLRMFLLEVDNSSRDQLWIRLSFIPNVWLGGYYLPPSDSPYYSDSYFSSIQERCMDSDYQFIVLGDFNSRLGSSIRDLAQEDNDIHITYSEDLPDPVQRANQNGRKLLQLCQDIKCVVVNNLKTATRHFKGALTFRKKNVWISELDLCIMSKTCIEAAAQFDICQNTNFPSDHAPISLTIDSDKLQRHTLDVLYNSASLLGVDAAKPHEQKCKSLLKKGIKIQDIDRDLFEQTLEQCFLPDQENIVSAPEDIADWITDSLYKTADSCRRRGESAMMSNTAGLDNRWKKILNSHDEKSLWKSIDWKGNFNPTPQKNAEKPSDEVFKEHLEALFNPENIDQLEIDEFDSDTNVPVLDNPICPIEVDHVIRTQLKADKGSGPDGISPSLLKVLPVRWIITLATLFNALFFSKFPITWIHAKIIMLFKKGCPTLCDNYRGISIINSLRKVYDYILCNRLQQWFTPDREQAGAQPNRGCMEHIVTLRLLMDLSIKKKLPLFIVYVDFSKAYDRVSRRTLLRLLCTMGCGRVMLKALVSLYRISKSILGSAIISAVQGIPQGSPSSCLLFTLYVNKLITSMKEQCELDGYLGWLHTLMLMDDTIILATSRQSCLKKLSILMDYTSDFGMRVNEGKTKFMALNTTKRDTETLHATSSDGFVTCNIDHADSYTYLGSIFTKDGKIASSIKAHANSKKKDLFKFVTFTCKNFDAPFCVKRKVFHACFIAAITYGCESWINGNLKPIENIYHGAIKALLNVRQSTCNDLCLNELSLPRIADYVKQCQAKFFDRLSKSDRSSVDDPYTYVLELCQSYNTDTAKYITNIPNMDFILNSRKNIKDKIRGSNKSKMKTYMDLSQTLDEPSLYSLDIPEYVRMSATRFRLSAHSLRIETGRWSRLQRHERLCLCGDEVQDEIHVIEQCQMVAHIRQNHPNLDFNCASIFKCDSPGKAWAIHDILTHFN